MKYDPKTYGRIRSGMSSVLILTLLMSVQATHAVSPALQEADPPSVGEYLQHMAQSWKPGKELEAVTFHCDLCVPGNKHYGHR